MAYPIPPEESDLERYAVLVRRSVEDAEAILIQKVRKRLERGLDQPSWAEEKLASIHELRRAIVPEARNITTLMEDGIREAMEGAYTETAEKSANDLKRAGLLNPLLAARETSAGSGLRALLGAQTGSRIQLDLQIVRAVEDAYRRIVVEASSQVTLGSVTLREATQNSLNRFADQGVRAFVDRSGRRWELGSYAEMATRTTVHQAQIQGKIDTWRSHNQFLMRVSGHPEACPLCDRWQGQVLSILEGHPRYPSVSLAKSEGLFHPNCTHNLDLYIEGVTGPPPPLPPQEVREENYRARMKQRHLERQVRKWKRRELVALDRKELNTAHARVLEWQKALKQHVESDNKRRSSLGISETRRFPERERVKFAPDAVRTPREAAGARKSLVAAQTRAVKTVQSAEKVVASGVIEEIKLSRAAKNEVERGIAAIESVHKVPKSIGKTRVGQTNQLGVDGSYNRRNHYIEINPAAPDLAGTFIHEFGHFLDHQDFDLPGINSSQDSPAFEDWRKAVRSTNAIKHLQSLRGKNTAIGRDGVERPVNQSYVEYLLRGREVWARSYRQYIAYKTNERGIINALKVDLADPMYRIHWEEDDFKPVSQAMADILKRFDL